MTASVVSFCHDIEEKGFNVIVESFVVQEKLCQQTQVLAVDLEAKGTVTYLSCQDAASMRIPLLNVWELQ